ncbi:hypothetical protein U6N30_28860 [Blastococcus brunescens]|uniref:Uncharacterized protein n=1 Tax=Blastococcus brunescens TaxID=1564165 RepID=A0ABZ1AYN1_9ACTN|nr:hypothetical protein [Blastococcus sp. BMG 8361]WRL63635.1 hypothetical protein U6N30_28860 [Blastococcus sp. BMG 8361]
MNSCKEVMVAERWVWTTETTSTPGVVTARASLMASSSRGAVFWATGEPNHERTSARPRSVIRYAMRPSPSAWPSWVTNPSRSRRSRVV